MKKDIGWAGCLGILVALLLLFVLYLAVVGGIITLLWNWLLVELFGWQQITWAMGIGIAILLGIVGSFFKVTVSSVR